MPFNKKRPHGRYPKRNKQMEEYAYVLDFLPYGRSDDANQRPVVQLVGEKFFTLLEAYSRGNVNFLVGERVFVGKGDRDKIDSIKNRIYYDQLTSTAKSSFRDVVQKIVKEREMEFVEFFNKCGPINIRVHQLELIPGIGKKLMNQILEEREKEPFKSLEDLEQRVHINKIVEFIAQRIEEELQGTRYYLFVRPTNM